MRGQPSAHELRAPASLDEALALLAAAPGAWRPLAGGTDLMVLFAMGRLTHARLLGLWHLAELRGILESDDSITLGALTTYTEIQAHPTLRREFPMLVQAAAETGGLAIQNRGTLGGNLANASPAADSSPPLLAYDAELELASATGRRRIPYASFHTGYKQTLLRPDELIAAIHLPRSPLQRAHTFHKVGPRRAQAISKVCLAVRLDHDATGALVAARVALGGVAPIPLRCPRTEAALVSGSLPTAVATLATEITPIDDLRSTAAYRTRVAQNLLGTVLPFLLS